MSNFSFNFANDAYSVPARTFEADGRVMSIGSISEADGVQASGTKITIAQLGIENAPLLLSEPNRGQRVNVYLGLLDADGNLIPQPYQLLGGRADAISVSVEPDSFSLTITVENAMIALQRALQRSYSDADQKAIYPGDRGLEYVELMKDVKIG